jgi:Nucleotidyltransferase substrate binding protein like
MHSKSLRKINEISTSSKGPEFTPLTMSEKQDVRWIQRFSNFNKALLQLQKFISKKTINELEEQGLIKSFEYTYELS